MKTLLIFCLGAAVGAAGMYAFMVRKSEALVREEVESVKEAYRTRAERSDISADSQEVSVDIPKEGQEDIMEYYKTVKNNGYDGKSADISGESPAAAHVIPPDAFGELDYDRISLNYWADKYLTDENDQIIDRPADILGEKALDSFGEYEDDAVYVRNDELRVDYEVLLESRKFADYYAKAYPGKTLE